MDYIANNYQLKPENRRGVCKYHKCYLSKNQIKVKRCYEKNCKHFVKYSEDKHYDIRWTWKQKNIRHVF